MAKFSVFGGATSESWLLFVQDSSSTIGAGLKGLAFNTSSLQCGWSFQKGFPASITLASLASATVAYLSGGFVEISQSIMPGYYRFDPPNSILAAGNGRYVDLLFFGAANMAPVPVEVELTATNNQNSITGGILALPNSIANVAGGLPVLDANSLIDVDVKRWLATAVQASVAGIPIVDMRFILGSLSPATAGYVAVDHSKMTSLAAIVFMSATTIAQVNTALAVTGNVNANVTSFAGTVLPASSVAGVPIVDTRYFNGSITPASAGYVAPDWSKVGSVSATQIFTNTTIAGLTQAISATVSGNVNANLTSIAGAAVNTAAAQLGINLVNVSGTVNPGSGGRLGIDWNQFASVAATNIFSNTTIAALQASVPATVSGNVNANVISIAGVAVNATVAQIGANVVQWGASAVPSPSIAGVPITDTRYFGGSISPASLGYVAADWSKTGSVAATQIFTNTTIAGLTQAISATVSGNVLANVTSIAGVAVNATLAQLGVNVVNWRSIAAVTPNIGGVPVVDRVYGGGSLVPAQAGYGAVDWSKMVSTAAVEILSGTTIAAIQQAISASISGNVNANVTSISGVAVNPSSAQIGTNIVALGGVANPASIGYVAADWSKTGSIASAQFFSGTTIASVGSVTSAQVQGGVTVNAYAPGQSPDSIVLGAAIENTITLKQSLQYIGAASAGVLAGASTSAISISALGNPATKRIGATVDVAGDRTSIVLS